MRDGKTLKKQPSDYPLFSFRLSHEEKEDLAERLLKARERLNRNKSDDEFIMTGNQILVEAIRLGLPLVKRK